MHISYVNSKYNAKSNDSDHIFVIRENMRLKHRCPLAVDRFCKTFFFPHVHKLHKLLATKTEVNIFYARPYPVMSQGTIPSITVR